MWKVGKFHLNHITNLKSVCVVYFRETCHVGNGNGSDVLGCIGMYWDVKGVRIIRYINKSNNPVLIKFEP